MLSIEGIIANTGRRERIEIDPKSGLILKVSKPRGVADVVLVEEIIFPGFIDLHVHAREDISHKEDYKEDFVTAGEAAINGGVVVFADMPNNQVPPINEESYKKKNILAKKSPVEVLLYAGIGPHTKPLNKKAPYKVFMSKSIGELFFSSFAELESVLKNYRGQDVSFHCEDPKILETNNQAKTHEARRPKAVEISAVDFALRLIKKYNLTGKICHCSTIEGMKKIIEAKKEGIKVTVEVTPHHLYFDETMLGGNRKKFQVNPPIRQNKKNRLALIRMLKNGDIDYLATDHAPHTVAEKTKGISGLTELDTYGPFVTWLMREHRFTEKEIVRICAQNPGNFLNKFLENRHGEIKKGYVGSLTILNMNQPIKITKKILKTKRGWSPFEGVIFSGRVAMTIIKGKILKDEVQ